MPSKNLTDRFIEGVKADERTNYFDEKIAGLTLRVTASGKRWAFVYRIHGSGPKWITMGSYPSLKLADARDLAGTYRHQVDVLKRDPVAEKKAADAAALIPTPPVAPVLTVGKYVPTFIAFQKGKKKTWKDDENKLIKYVVPAWGELPIKSITRLMFQELLASVGRKGLTVGVNRLQAVMSRMFTIALDHGLIDAHPGVKVIKHFDENARDRVLDDDEIRRLYAELVDRPSEAADVVWLRLLLGQRGEETAGMIWREIDLDARTWFLNGVRTKNGHPHLLWLPDMAIAILQRRRDAVGANEKRVFPAMAGNNQDRRNLYGVAQAFDDFDWRDLRRTISTRLPALGVDGDTIGKLLNHADQGVTDKHYNHYKYLPEKRRALDRWDAELGRILRNEPKPKTAVIDWPMSA